MERREAKPVLVLEDQILIAIYVEELLREAGFENVTTYASCAAAADWLTQNTPHIVIMETRLRDGSSDQLAAELASRGIPFIVHTVETDGSLEHQQMAAKCRWITKPCDPDEFVRAVREHALA